MSNDKAPFAWDDPFSTKDQFTEEERMIQFARDYAQDKLEPKRAYFSQREF